MQPNSSKYSPQIEGQLAAMLAAGNLSQREISRRTGVAPTTLRRWMRENPSLRKAVESERQTQLDSLHTLALEGLKRKLTGYSTSETKTVYTADADGNRILKDETVVTKEIAPDLTAIVFTLCNRAPQLWQQKPERTEESSSSQPTPMLDLGRLSETALRELAQAYTPVDHD